MSRANEAVYEAIQKAPGAAPDQLRFQYDPPGHAGLPNIIIKSFEKRQEIVFLAAITNGSGVISVSGHIPFENLPHAMQENHRSMHAYYVQNPERYKRSFGLDYTRSNPEGLDIGSIVSTVSGSLNVGSLPKADQAAPILVLLPEFERKRHISTSEAISAGIGSGAFKLHHCERKRRQAQ